MVVVGNRTELKPGQKVEPKLAASSIGGGDRCPAFSIRNPYFIIVCALMVAVVGVR